MLLNGAVEAVTDGLDGAEKTKEEDDSELESTETVDETEDDNSDEADNGSSDTASEVIIKGETVLSIRHLERTIEIDSKSVEKNADSESVGENTGGIETVNEADDDEEEERVEGIKSETDGVPEEILFGIGGNMRVIFCFGHVVPF